MRKTAIVALSALCLCFTITSCYPELSVQQYDELKEDIQQLNDQSAALEGELAAANTELAAVTAELATVKGKNTEIRAYVDFMVELISTQNSESLLEGKFDVEALAEAKPALVLAAGILDDTSISYYVGLIDANKEAETLGAYYKAIEYCIKNIKQKLSVNGNPSTSGS